MRVHFYRLAAWLLAGAALSLAGGERDIVRTRISGAAAAIENAHVEVVYDLKTGNYSAIDKRDGEIRFSNARLLMCCAASAQFTADETYLHAAQAKTVKDDLGEGKSLLIRSSAPGKPTLLLEITLHSGSGAIILGAGVANTLGTAIQVKQLDPLSNARLSAPPSDLKECRTLDGVAGSGATMVRSGLVRESPNDLLLTCPAQSKRLSLVLGGLTYHDFAKWVSITRTPGGKSSLNMTRQQELAERSEAAGGRLLGYVNCGNEKESLFMGAVVRMYQITGETLTLTDRISAPWFGDVAADPRDVVFTVHGLESKKSYALGFSWWDYDNAGRVESVYVLPARDMDLATLPGRELLDVPGAQRVTLLAKQTLPGYRGRKQMPEERVILLPPEIYQDKSGYGNVQVHFTNESAAPNAVVSEVWVSEAIPGKLPSPSPPVVSFAPPSEPTRAFLNMTALDPVGRRVDPGTTYVPDDRFYLDFTTPNPFEALERYGLAVRAAQHAKPNIYDFPTVCGWYVDDYGGGPKINNTPGLVGEVEEARKAGFLKYAPMAVRLVPEPDGENIPSSSGWWDDEHYQKYGHYREPYETTEKWCKAVRERGGLPFTYTFSNMPSPDYAQAHPDQMLFNDISKLGLQHWHHEPLVVFDFSDPGFQAHMQEVWGNFGKAGLAGVMFDYPETAWRPEGGFEDKYATTASVYRKTFALAREGLGPGAYLHERALGSTFRPMVDVSAGLVDSQRIWTDSPYFHPAMVRICGLRWYKNRVLYTYDMDGKQLQFERMRNAAVRPENSVIRRRAILTTLYVTAGRVLLADSFRELTPDAVHDLSRIFPMHREARSPRPVDAFTGAPDPKVYDFAVTSQWHQVMFFNPDFRNKGTVSAWLSGDQTKGALGLDASSSYYVYDFWDDHLVGKLSGNQQLKQELQPGEARMMSVHKVETHPQFLSTNRHIMQGYMDMPGRPGWDATSLVLSGESDVVGGETYKVVLATNGYTPVSAEATDGTASIKGAPGAESLAVLSIDCPKNGAVRWKVKFAK
jgi:hypothetical protein